MLALFDQTIFATLPPVYREVDRALDPNAAERGRRVRAVPPMGHLGGRRSRRQPRVTAEVTRAAMAIQADHALRGLEAAARRIARTLSVSERDVPPSRALRRALDRDARELPEVAAELGRTLPDAPHRRKLGLAAASARRDPRRATPARYDRAAGVPRRTSRRLQRSLDAGGAPAAGVGRAAAPAVAGGDVRVPSRLDGGAAAFAACSRRPRAEVAEAAATRPSPQTPGGVRDVPGDRRHPAPPGTPGLRARTS